MTQRAHASPDADHRLHDQLLVVRSVAGDLHRDEVALAEALVGRCAECAALADDLRSISRATASLPAPARRRDFRLTPEQAKALRGSEWTRFLRWLATPRLAILQPLAGAAVAIGLVLVVFGTNFPGGPSGTVNDPRGDPVTVTSTEGSGAHETGPDATDAAAIDATTDGGATGRPGEPHAVDGTAPAATSVPDQWFQATSGPEATAAEAAAATGGASTAAATAGELPGETGAPAYSGASPSPGSVVPAQGSENRTATTATPAPPQAPTRIPSAEEAPAVTGEPDDTTGSAARPSPTPRGGEVLAPGADQTETPPAGPGGPGQAIVLLGAALAAAGVLLLVLRLLARRTVMPR